RTPVRRARRSVARYRGVPTFADSTKTDDGAYDDPIVREAAVSALGRYNGAVVAVDPNTGRILTVVNQKIAFGDGYIPCSTIKPTIALAALEENVITRDTMLKVGRRKYMNLTEAMAHSNNVFFERGGDEMPLGKTGTCDDHTNPSKIGWFLTYADDAHPKIALAVLLRGNTRRVKGPTAAVVAGRIYRRLREQNYFADSAHAVAI